MNKKNVLCLALFLIVSIIVFSQAGEVKPAFGLGKFGLIYADAYAGLGGFEIAPGAESKALLYLGGGYFFDAYYRDEAGARLRDPDFAFPGAAFNYWGAEGALGLDLGLAYSEKLEKNWLFGQVYLKSEFHSIVDDPANPSIIDRTSLPDKDGLWENSLFLGLTMDRICRDRLTKVSSGIKAEASAEWAPGFALNQILGNADYFRFNGKLTALLPLIQNETFSIYTGDRIVFDLLTGPEISSYAQRRTGGFFKAKGMGGDLRGLKDGQYDANIKLINNIDFRMTFPSLLGLGEIVVPELFLFFDMGLMDNLDNQLCSFADGLYTCGGGIFVDLYIIGMNFDVGYYISYSIPENHWNFFNLALGSHQF